MAKFNHAAFMLKKRQEKEKMESLQKELQKDIQERKIPNIEPPKPAMSGMSIKEKMAALAAAKKQEKTFTALPTETAPEPAPAVDSSQKVPASQNTYIKEATESGQRSKSDITYDDLNAEQRLAVEYAERGIEFVLTGAAGTGKTTTQKMIIQKLLDTNQVTPIQESTKYLVQGNPAIAIVSFTNVAVKNIAEVVPAALKSHCVTIHKLLEFKPEKEEVYEYTEDGDEIEKTKLVFKPARTALNKLSNLQLVIIEEASNVGTKLFQQLVDACPSYCRFIFLGDINQLKPIADDGILGFKLGENPVVELKEVHRQAKESKILSFAHKILSGIAPLSTEKMIAEFKKEGELEFIKFAKRMDGEEAMDVIGHLFQNLVKAERFVPYRDIVLCPFATGGDVNTDQINKYIAQAYSDMNGEEVYEILAGRNKVYVAKGDTVYYNKETWTVSDIQKNSKYAGKPARLPSKTMDRWGHDPNEKRESMADLLNMSLSDEALEMDGEEIKNQASHIVFLENSDGTKIGIHTAGDFSTGNFSFGYSLTVHKAQGSEWPTVYLILHHTHSVAANRELLYTAVTRARKKLVILFDDGKHMFDPESIIRKGITTSQIKGNTLEAKIAYFREKIEAQENKRKFLESRATAGE